jgi:hypothetical protein
MWPGRNSYHEMLLLVVEAFRDTPGTFGAKLSSISFHSNFVRCRELYIEYHKKQVAKVDDARVTFELSTVLSKEVTHLHTFTLSDIEILD